MQLTDPKLKKLLSGLMLAASISASLAGILAFVLLFVPDYNIYWIILTPVILAVYQIPAALLFKLHKKFKIQPYDPEDLSPSPKNQDPPGST